MHFFLKPLAGSSLWVLPAGAGDSGTPRRCSRRGHHDKPRARRLPPPPLVPREPGWAPDAVPGRQRSQGESERVAEATRVPQTGTGQHSVPSAVPECCSFPPDPHRPCHTNRIRHKEGNPRLFLGTCPKRSPTQPPRDAAGDGSGVDPALDPGSRIRPSHCSLC